MPEVSVDAPKTPPKIRTAAAVPERVVAAGATKNLSKEQKGLAEELRKNQVRDLEGLSEVTRAIGKDTSIAAESPGRVLSENFRPNQVDDKGNPRETADLKSMRETATQTQADVRKLIDAQGMASLTTQERGRLVAHVSRALDRVPTLKAMVPDAQREAIITEWLNDHDVLTQITKLYNETFSAEQIFTDSMPAAEKSFREISERMAKKQEELGAKQKEQEGNEETINNFGQNGESTKRIVELTKGRNPDELRRELAAKKRERQSLDEDIRDYRQAARSGNQNLTQALEKTRKAALDIDQEIADLEPTVTEIDSLEAAKRTAEGKVKTLAAEVERLTVEHSSLESESFIAKAEVERQGYIREEQQRAFAARVSEMVPKGFLTAHEAREQAVNEQVRTSFEQEASQAKSKVEQEGLRGIAERWYSPNKGRITKDKVLPDVKVFLEKGRVAYLRQVLEGATYLDENGERVHLTDEAIDQQMKDPAFVERMSKAAASELMAQAIRTGAVKDKDLEYMIYRDGAEFGEGVINEALKRRAGASEKVKELKAQGVLKGEGLREWVKNNKKKLSVAGILAILLAVGYSLVQSKSMLG